MLSVGQSISLASIVSRQRNIRAFPHEHLEGIDPIELVIDEPRGELRRVISWLRPPQMRHGQLRDIDFELRELGPA